MNKEPANWDQLLADLEKRGVRLYLDGRASKSWEIRKKCRLCEKTVYMPDFVINDAGQITEVWYDRVKKW